MTLDTGRSVELPEGVLIGKPDPVPLIKRCGAGCGRLISANKQACFTCWQRALEFAYARQAEARRAAAAAAVDE